MMKSYDQQHQFYCGVDLHAKSLHACVVDAQGNKPLHKNFLCQKPKIFIEAITSYKAELFIGCESTFNWYWLADLLREAGLRFILGHALYMKAIHGGKNPMLWIARKLLGSSAAATSRGHTSIPKNIELAAI